jgi:hypothetical protein
MKKDENIKERGERKLRKICERERERERERESSLNQCSVSPLRLLRQTMYIWVKPTTYVHELLLKNIK